MPKSSVIIPFDVDLAWRMPANHKQAGMAQVHLWAKAGDVAGLERWLQAGGSLDEPWSTDLNGDGSTPLLFAVMDSRSNAMAWLLQHGVNANARNGRQRNALHLVAHRFSSGSRPLQDLEDLIRAGVDLHAFERPGDSTTLGAEGGITPFQAELGRGIFANTGKSYRMDHLRCMVDMGLDLRPDTPMWRDADDILGQDELSELVDRAAHYRVSHQRALDLSQRPASSRRSRHRS